MCFDVTSLLKARDGVSELSVRAWSLLARYRVGASLDDLGTRSCPGCRSVMDGFALSCAHLGSTRGTTTSAISSLVFAKTPVSASSWRRDLRELRKGRRTCSFTVSIALLLLSSFRWYTLCSRRAIWRTCTPESWQHGSSGRNTATGMRYANGRAGCSGRLSSRPSEPGAEEPGFSRSDWCASCPCSRRRACTASLCLAPPFCERWQGS